MDEDDEDDYWQLHRQWDPRVQESMRERQTGVRTNPSQEDRKVRRRNRRATAGGDVQKRAELVHALNRAASLAEQARLLDEIAKIDAGLTAKAAQDREVDFANAVVRETLSPVRVHERHTAATDWLGYEASIDPQWQNRVVAEAAMWVGRVPDFVKADREEFAIQAQGKARQVAGQFGTQAEAARKIFTDYVAFIHRQGASGLDQIQQTVDPNNQPKETPLNPEVFDNFAPEVDPINAGVSGTEDSNRAPMIQEIMSGGTGGDPGAPEKPGGHSVDDELSWAPPEGMQQDSAPGFSDGDPGAPEQADRPNWDKQASRYAGPGMAISHTMNMDEYRAQQRTAKVANSLGKCTGCGKGLSVANAADREGKVCKGCARKSASRRQAASGLPQIQQTVDANNQPSVTPLPPDVAFPLDDDMSAEWTTNGTGIAQPGKAASHKCSKCKGSIAKGKCAKCGKACACKGCKGKSATRKGGAAEWDEKSEDYDPDEHARQLANEDEPWPERWNKYKSEITPYPRQGSRKQADMYGNSDEPHAVVQPDVANNPTTTPPTAQNGGGAAAGRADAQAGNASTFADDSFNVPTPAQQYPEGYGSMSQAQNQQDVPASMAGPGNGVTHAGSKVSALIVTAKERAHPEFRKGYGYATNWKPGTRLVSTGSSEFEAGLYAGISDNPQHQRAFVEAHRAVAKKFPKIAARADQHKRVTARVVSKNEVPSNGMYLLASTSLDLNTTAPNTTPAADGSTPINGPGRPGPLDGQQQAAAPGGPSPYNGAEPFGSPVVPGAGQSPAGPADALIGGGHMSTTQQVMSSRALAFRRTVQSALLATRKGK